MAKKKNKKAKKLKKELGVEGFRNEWEQLQLNLLSTSNWINQNLRNIYADLSITPQQANVLRIINEAAPNPINIEGIKAKVTEGDADMSRMINRLVVLKLIDKQVRRTDRRQSDIMLTESGKAALLNIEEKLMESDKMFFNLNKKEVKELNLLLDKIRL
jgi:DNA-binding MarR family transcriptional regulator